jgi:hypothetical protein
MGVKSKVVKIAEQFSAGRRLVEAARLRRVQGDWSTVHRAAGGRNALQIFTTVGLGDVMIAKQCCESFVRYFETSGYSGVGKIVITAGAWPPGFRVEKGDHNIHWWWSMNGQDDWLASADFIQGDDRRYDPC